MNIAKYSLIRMISILLILLHMVIHKILRKLLLGCYRLNDGSFMRYPYFDRECQSAKECFITTKILAPIYEENSKCSINWKTSSYLVDNKPWQYVPKPDNDITISPAENSWGVYVKVSFEPFRLGGSGGEGR